MTSIISEGIGPVTGPSVAKLILISEAEIARRGGQTSTAR